MKAAPLRSLALVAVLFAGLSLLSSAAPQSITKVTRIVGVTPEQAEILSHMSLVTIDDGFGNPLQTLRIDGLNVQIVNGLGATNGNPGDVEATMSQQTQVNGLGNLIIGYNTRPTGSPSPRTGSHNLVLGTRNDYDSFGSIMSGVMNNATAPYASVLSGRDHRSEAEFSVIVTGEDHRVTGPYSAIISGEQNEAGGDHAFVGGGLVNEANGTYSSVMGGAGNLSSAIYSAVSGGSNNTASNSSAWVGGGGGNTASGTASAVSGGYLNTASGFWASASGGQFHTAGGQLDWVAGSLFEDE